LSGTALTAAVAAAVAVWGVWEAAGALEDLAPGPRLARVLAPLRLAGRAGREATAPERRRLALVGAAGLLSCGWLLGGPVLGLGLATVAPAGVGRLLAARRRRWRRGLAATLPGVARALADALSGGRSVRGALQEVGAAGAVAEPAANELAVAASRLALGERTEDVLEALRRRAGDPSWDLLVAAILLQRRAGGDLVALLRAVAAGRERARRAEADARSATAQARATARLVAGMPVAGLVLVELAAPGTLPGIAADPRARLLLVAALGLGAIALAVVRRLARVGVA